MTRRSLAIIVVCMLAPIVLLAFDKIDPRLATIRKVMIQPVDDLGQDVGVAACLADRLPKLTPLTVVKTKEEAEAIFKVKAHIPGATTRVMVGIMGGTPSANLEVQLVDGTKLWADGDKLRRAINGAGATTGDVASPVMCGLAEELIDTLREAMKKARDGK